ncbi:hypothetical protein PMAYCL1PPCAC_10460, partial [Pristionchus mayeri]
IIPIFDLIRGAYLEDSQTKPSDLAKQIAELFNENLTVTVVKRIRMEVGLHKGNLRYGHSVRLQNRAPRYSFCRLHLDMGTMFTSHCFTDESMVQSGVKGRYVYILKGDNSRRVKPRFKHPPSVRSSTSLSFLPLSLQLMIWGGISWEGATPIVILRRGTKVDGGVYQTMLHKVYRPWAKKKYGGEVTLVQDNARCHVSESTRSYMANEEIETMEWPAESPDLNPVEMAWAHMKQWLQSNDKGASLTSLEEGIREWWSTKLTKDHCRKLILRMQKQMKKVVEAKGGPVYD